MGPAIIDIINSGLAREMAKELDHHAPGRTPRPSGLFCVHGQMGVVL